MVVGSYKGTAVLPVQMNLFNKQLNNFFFVTGNFFRVFILERASPEELPGAHLVQYPVSDSS